MVGTVLNQFGVNKKVKIMITIKKTVLFIVKNNQLHEKFIIFVISNMIQINSGDTFFIVRSNWCE